MSHKPIARLLVSLGLLLLAASATFGQTEAPPSLDRAGKQAVVEEVSRLLNANYVFPETARKLESALRAGLAAGDFDRANDAVSFAQAVSRVLLEVGKDRHMGFGYNPAAAEDLRRLAGQSAEEAARVRDRRLQESRRDNFGFRKVEQLAGNVGYLDFRVFASPDQAGPTAIAAMNFLAYCDAIIIDLRQNGGGDPAQIRLISSYFFSERVHLNDIYTRATGKTEEYWTQPDVPGAKPVDAALYVLTSSRTFSGAEEFAYNLKNLKRATIIGETTGGGAHPTRPMIVQRDFIFRVPYARAVNPITKTNWEGTGVTPDVAVPAAQALDRAYEMALEKLVDGSSEPERKARYHWVLIGLKAKANPVLVDEKILRAYAGGYGERNVTLENGTLYYQRTGPRYRLVPMTDTLFAVEGLDYFRVEFVVQNGRTVQVIGLYDNGRREPSPRTK